MRREASAAGGPVEIRQIGVEGFEPALGLLERFFREEGFTTPADAMAASLRAMLTSPDHAVFLAWAGKEAVGVATVAATVGIEYGRSAEMDDLYVLPQARSGGVASALIEAACAWCSEQGCTVMLVTVTPEGEAQHNLMGFYRRRGFAYTGRVLLERTLR